MRDRVLAGVVATALVVPHADLGGQETPPVQYFNPDWSPDGSTIAFESTRDGEYALYTIQADGTGLQRLTDLESARENPRWSPDGREIAFISDRSGRLQIYVMSADGSRERRLTRDEAIDYQPAWSPDGEWIAFVSRAAPAGVVHDIHIVRTGGYGAARLTGPNAGEMQPRWSPDGEEILFVRAHPPQPLYGAMTPAERDEWRASADVWVMRKDGSHPRRLTDEHSADCCAWWSPDGRSIYYRSDSGSSSSIYRMARDGSDRRRIADGGVVTDPNISPDGSRFVYARDLGGTHRLFVYDLHTGEEHLLVGP